MRKYECNACGIRICTAEYQSGSGEPFKCTGVSDMYYKPQWKEIVELRKLTTKVFDRPDCPEWAKWAAVSYHGVLTFFEEKPYKEGVRWVCDSGRYNNEYPERYCSNTWQNSLIERPAKLPEWWKVGEWVYHKKDKQYEKVTYTSEGGSYDWFVSQYLPARLRPYNEEEIPDLPFEVSEINSNFRTTVVSCKGEIVLLAGALTAISTEELMREFTTKGKPCGVLEHLENGEWVR